MDDEGLKSLSKAWKYLAMENNGDLPMHARCAIRVYEYEQKAVGGEREHEERLAKMSVSKHVSSNAPMKNQNEATPDGSKKQNVAGSVPSTPPSNTCPTARTTPTSVYCLTRKAEEYRRAKAEKAAMDAARAEARIQEKAQRTAAKQAHLDRKASTVRVEKEKQKSRVKERIKKEAEYIARVHAKAGVPPFGTIGADDGNRSDASNLKVNSMVGSVECSVGSSATSNETTVAKSVARKICAKCGLGHSSFRKWRMCVM